MQREDVSGNKVAKTGTKVATDLGGKSAKSKSRAVTLIADLQRADRDFAEARRLGDQADAMSARLARRLQ
jgi:hypothetical protein